MNRSFKLTCSECNFKTDNHTNLKRHFLTKKHIKNQKPKVDEEECNHKCQNCGKKYKGHSGLLKHGKLCKYVNIVVNTADTKQDVMLNEIKNLNHKIEEMDKKMKQPPMIINSHSQTINNNFNINVYLNDKCGKAINLDDFMKSIIIEDDDCQMFMHKRYLSGTIEILRRRLGDLPIEERPIQCLHGEDKRQQILHVRNRDEWFEEAEKDWLYQITAVEDDDDIEEEKLLHLYRSLKLYDDNILSQFKRILEDKQDYKKNRNEYDCHDRKMFSGSTNGFNKIMIINNLLAFSKVEVS
jgi:hypothetical protein